MIKGTYVFYEDGKEICRSSNLITKYGKRFLTNYMAGTVSFEGKNMALGIATSSEYALSDTNSRLGFEFYRMPVDFGTSNIQSDGAGGFTYSVIYKSTIPKDIAGVINEIGLYPSARLSSNYYDSKFISDFDDNILWVDTNGDHPVLYDSVSSVLPRSGKYFMRISSPSVGAMEYTANVNTVDISGYSVNDSLTISYYEPDQTLGSIKVRFYSSDIDYFEAVLDADGSVGNHIVSTTLSSMLSNPVGAPNAKAISKIGILAVSSSSAPTYVYLDGLRINDEDTFDPAYGLISRSIITGGLVKESGRQVDVEYRLELF